MKGNVGFWTTAIFAVTILAGIAPAQGVVTLVEDFEGELPGPQSYPGGYNFFGGGTGNPTVTEEITASGGFSSLQSFQITIDATVNASTYFYYGFGGFFGFFGEGFGFAQGQPGEDNPGNYTMSFDLKVQGNDGDQAATPVGGGFAVYQPNYEALHNVDLNNDGMMDDGYDIWKSDFVATVVDNNYTHITWNLDGGTAPTTDPLVTTGPQFEDEATFAFQIFLNSGGFGNDANNVINIDNFALTFTPSMPPDGDFDFDDDVDGQDFLIWQRGESPNPLTPSDLALWRTNFGAGGASPAVSAIPEPSSLALMGVMLVTLSIASRTKGRSQT